MPAKRPLSFECRLKLYKDLFGLSRVSPLFCYRLCVLALNKAAAQFLEWDERSYDKPRLTEGEAEQLKYVCVEYGIIHDSVSWCRKLALALVDDIEALDTTNRFCFLPCTNLKVPEAALSVRLKLVAVRECAQGGQPKYHRAAGLFEFAEHIKTHFGCQSSKDACTYLSKNGPPFDDECPEQSEMLKDFWAQLIGLSRPTAKRDGTPGAAWGFNLMLLRLYDQEAAYKKRRAPFTLAGLKTPDYEQEASELRKRKRAEVNELQRPVTIVID